MVLVSIEERASRSSILSSTSAGALPGSVGDRLLDIPGPPELQYGSYEQENQRQDDRELRQSLPSLASWHPETLSNDHRRTPSPNHQMSVPRAIGTP
jgi:hypothetical protein